MSKNRTIEIYDARAQDYADLVETTKMPGLDAFLNAMPKGAHILDLGCGPGNSAVHMAAAGHRVTAFDASIEMVTRANQYPGVTAQQATFDDLTGEALYDGLWASFSLLHAPKSEFPRHLAALHRAAKKGARLHISMKTGSGEYEDSIGRFYAYYTIEELDRYLTEAGFTVGDHLEGEEEGLSGEVSPWVAMTAHA